MPRPLMIAAVLGLAACAPEAPPAAGAQPTAAASRPAPPRAYDPRDTGVEVVPGLGGAGGY